MITPPHPPCCTEAERLGHILDVIREGVWEWNANSGEVKRSPGWYRMLNYTTALPANVLTWENTIHPDDYPRVMQHFEDYLSGRCAAYRIEYRCLNATGDSLWIEDRGKIVLRNSDGSPALMIGAHLNIHAQKIAQEALQQQNSLLNQNKDTLEDLLESLIRNRTAELIAINRKLATNLREIDRLRNLDHLTAIYNRHKLERELSKEIARAQRYHSPLCVALFDLDHFKVINDNHGHHTGDTALQNISALVTAHLRETDILGRWGGDEFFLLLPGIDIHQAHTVIDKLREQIATTEIIPGIHITCSFGLTSIDPEDTLTSIYKRADQALYKAKHLGRNRVVND